MKIPWLVFCLSISICSSVTSVAQLPPVQRRPWDLKARDSAAVIDRHVVGESSDRFRRTDDNSDRIHLTLRYYLGGYRGVTVTVPRSWGEEKAVVLATDLAKQMRWPLSSRVVLDMGTGYMAAANAVPRKGAYWEETIPWPELAATARRAGAGKIEYRLRSSGIPFTSTGGALEGWHDADAQFAASRSRSPADLSLFGAMSSRSAPACRCAPLP